MIVICPWVMFSCPYMECLNHLVPGQLLGVSEIPWDLSGYLKGSDLVHKQLRKGSLRHAKLVWSKAVWASIDVNMQDVAHRVKCRSSDLLKLYKGELVEIQSYIARRPEASSSIDRRNNKSTDIHYRTSVDKATNRGWLVPKITSDMSDTHYHGEEISTDTYATIRRHQFNLKSLGERLQRMENTTATMKEKWHRGDEAMRDFTALPTATDINILTSVDIHYGLEPKLTSNTKLDTTACLGAWYTWDRIHQTSLEGPDTCLKILASCDRYSQEQSPEMTIELDHRSILERNIDVHVLTSIDSEARRKPVWSQHT
ncbi:hypothetical protein F2Q69_00022887 [Brassica cretica]|uniref:Uncharacterized protein n=1 Tax=Brassica cretica TaxID=69181 RepID=A0A8S9Q6C5_BRACR|nr:hypothetical protein F2Q69_00022887 [Brassica cretica]